MLKKWILATALAVLPFAATAKKPAKAKTAAVSSVKADTELEKIMGGFSESEKAALRKSFVAESSKLPEGVNMLIENDSLTTIFVYSDEDKREVVDTFKEFDDKTAFSMLAIEMLGIIYGKCGNDDDNSKKVYFALLKLADIASLSVRITDKNGKTLGEVSRPIPDCAVTQQ